MTTKCIKFYSDILTYHIKKQPDFNVKKLKCINDNYGYYKVGECFDVIDNYCNNLTIEVDKGYSSDKTMKAYIQYTQEDLENGIIRNFDAEFKIIK